MVSNQKAAKARRARAIARAGLLGTALVTSSAAHADYDAANGVQDDSFRDRVSNQHVTAPGVARFDESSVSARTRHAGWRDAVDGVDESSLRLRIRYPVALGYRDAHGLFDPNPTSCDAFHISAAPENASRDDRQPQLIKIAARPGMRQEGGDYVCDYVVSYLPLDTPIRVQAGIGNARERSTEAWQGGEDARPSLGQFRAVLDDTRMLSLSADRPSASLEFRMAYAGGIPNDGFAERVDAGRRDAVAAALALKPAPDPRICAYARSSRARNSPAAAGLERQCRASGGTPR